MIAYVSGVLARVETDFVIIDVNGIGYKVFSPHLVIAEMPTEGTKVRLFTYMHVKEDAVTLYGFLDNDQQSLFELLITVTGVGPKVALNILSGLTVQDVVGAISRDDFHSLTRVSGVGNKMAQRIVLELREKITKLAWAEKAKQAAVPVERALIEDVIEGLIALGYDRQSARKAAEESLSSANDKKDTSEVLRRALQLLTQ